MPCICTISFQSTHPKRDETLYAPCDCTLYDISIHSSQTGWDFLKKNSYTDVLISIHSSQTGWDVTNFNFISFLCISIHSSQTGWDCQIELKAMQNIDFNPLIPNGMRLFQLSISFKTAYFNPLIPNGMRRFYHLTSLWCPLFQSTHPKRDETKTSHQFRSRIWFQSTHPKRDETISGTWIWQRAYQISIHSSQTGWDQFVIDARVAFFRISIHSSQTGWDIGRFVVKGTNNWFQSTHPKRDETGTQMASNKPVFDFNPLIPNGMRP